MRVQRARPVLAKRLSARDNELRKTAPIWCQPLRWLTVGSICVYYRLAYRIVDWGSLPSRRGSTLIVANHQHEIESPVIVAMLAWRTRAWRYPIFTVSSRRMWEPGFLAERIPWLTFLLRSVNLGPLFSAIGMQPIENELHTRPFASLAYTLRERYGDLAMETVFRTRALERLPRGIRLLSDLLAPAHFQIGRTTVTLSELNEPYRHEALEATREQLEADLGHFEALARAGATIFLTPEGFYSGDGKMQRLRGVLSRLQPVAHTWLTGVSYEPFAQRRLCMLYRVQRAVDGIPLEIQLKRLRPVTVSALLATWLRTRSEPFTQSQAGAAIERQLNDLPPALFVEPQLRRHPESVTRAALAGMVRLGILRREGSDYALAGRRTHPQFPRTTDMIEYQANFHEETLEGARSDVA